MAAASPTEVKKWLEWAGASLLSLPVSSTRPHGFRSFWPTYADDVSTAYGYTTPRTRPVPPSSVDISLMDSIFDLILLVDQRRTRRILQARALVSPVNGRHIYHWTTIAVLVRSNRRDVAAEHKWGLKIIADKVDLASVARFRNFI